MNLVTTKTVWKWLLCPVLLAGISPCQAADKVRAQQGEFQAEPVRVEFHTAIQEQMIEVGVVPSSYSSLTMRVRNATRQPLQIRLPDTFAAVPAARMQARNVLQMQGLPASLSNTGQGPADSQGVGGSLAGPWWGNSLTVEDPTQPAQEAGQLPQGGSASLFIAPGRFVQAQIPCFCLEFGKPDPHSRIPYVLCALPELNDRPAVADLLRQFVKPGMSQEVVQLAVWHLANDVPWQVLSQVQFPRTRISRGHRVTPQELLAARQLAEILWSQGGQSSLSDK